MSTTTNGRPLGVRPPGNPALPALSGAIKMMDVGNSLVAADAWAEANAVAYRAALSARFAALGVTVTWVGPYTGGGIAHAGVSGSLLTDHAAAIAAWLTTYTPDVVIILSGHNDTAASAATIDARYATLLSAMYVARPSCRVVPCLPPIAGPTPMMSRLAECVPLWQATWAASSYAVDGLLRAADLRGCIQTRSARDTAAADGLHPTPLSYERIASALWPTLLNAIGRSAEW